MLHDGEEEEESYKDVWEHDDDGRDLLRDHPTSEGVDDLEFDIVLWPHHDMLFLVFKNIIWEPERFWTLKNFLGSRNFWKNFFTQGL